MIGPIVPLIPVRQTWTDMYADTFPDGAYLVTHSAQAILPPAKASPIKADPVPITSKFLLMKNKAIPIPNKTFSIMRSTMKFMRSNSRAQKGINKKRIVSGITVIINATVTGEASIP